MFTARTWDFAHKSTWSKRCELWISVRSTCSQNSIEGKEKVTHRRCHSTGQWALQTNGQRICSSRLSICSSRLSICSSRLSNLLVTAQYLLFRAMELLLPDMVVGTIYGIRTVCSHERLRGSPCVLFCLCQVLVSSSLCTLHIPRTELSQVFLIVPMWSSLYPIVERNNTRMETTSTNLGMASGFRDCSFDMKPPRLAVVIFRFICRYNYIPFSYLSGNSTDLAW